MTEIGHSAFGHCDNLTSVTLSNKLTRIEKSLFNSCYKLDSVVIPNSVKEICDYAFQWCKLTKLIIGENVETIGARAFTDCKMKNLIIPNSVKEIGAYAFAHCPNLTEVTLGENVETISNYAFNGCPITSIIIPNSVKVIGPSSFELCKNLTEVTLGENVETIESCAFYRCPIKRLYSLNTIPPTLHDLHSISYCGTVYVPIGCYERYKSSPYWEKLEIKEMDFSTGITQPTTENNEQTFEIVDGKIHFNKDGENIYIYNIDGTIVYKGVSQCGKTVEVPAKGIYIVKSGSYSTKVAL